MRHLLSLCIIISFVACNNSVAKKITFADNVVVAHRGAWKAKGLPKNSIASLKEAINLKCTGSEFDVRMTSDNILIVTHDPAYHGLEVEESTYEELAQYKLANGEKLPTLKEYILAGMNNNSSTGLVCEIKPSKIEGRNIEITNDVLALVKELNAEAYISYFISFSYKIIKHIKEIDSNAKVLYLDGSKSPKNLKKDSITGLDYLVYKLRMKPDWIAEAKRLDLVLNAWTANTTEDIDWLLANNFNYITTDEPELAFERIQSSPTSKGYELVWNDEFDYGTKPDSLKWGYNYGFIANQEDQYYTDRLKNVRIEDGHLIIETHKETVVNKDFNNPELLKKSWMKYAAERKTSRYTSARLTTKDFASWKYGRIEVRSKLPKGVGLWPAIWMLGENRDVVGWPETGEIDIMEHVGFSPDSIFGTVHTKAYNHMKNTEKGRNIFIDKPYDSFHIFSVEWTPEKINFLLDNSIYNSFKNEYKTTEEWPFDQKFYLILNVAVGGMLGGQKGIDDTVFPQQMYIDYVRVYQQKK